MMVYHSPFRAQKRSVKEEEAVVEFMEQQIAVVRVGIEKYNFLTRHALG
jgi:hypothetical protein